MIRTAGFGNGDDNMIGTNAAPTFKEARAAREAALHEARRGLILNGAWSVFRRDGLDGATMRAIALASGCTTGAIYPLFASKEAIYAALLMQSLECLHAEVAAAAQDQEPLARLRAAANSFLGYYRDKPDEVTLGLYLWNGVRPRGLTPEADRNLNRRLADTLGIVERAFNDAGAGEPQAETAALFAFLIGALLVHQTGRLRTLNSNLDAIAGRHIDCLVTALAKP